MPIIYLDILIVLNWLIDGVLLALTARICRVSIRRVRMAVSSLFGGVCACQILLTIPMAVSVLLHITSAAVMVLIAFPYRSHRAFVRTIAVLWCLSALLSGVVTALWYLTDSAAILTQNGVVYCEISPLMLSVFALMGYGVVRLYDRLTHHRMPPALEYIVTVDDGIGECECRALYDTGLHLREPFSDRPVIVVQRRAVQPYLRNTPPRMIPYRTVGGTGLLPATVPKRVTIHAVGSPPRDISGVYVALSDTAENGDYTALIGADVLEGDEKR